MLPIMEDPTWPQDTLFFVVEEDWRLRSQDEHHEQETGVVDVELDPVMCKVGNEPSAVQEKLFGPAPRSLSDLVCMCMQAHRAGYGVCAPSWSGCSDKNLDF